MARERSRDRDNRRNPRGGGLKAAHVTWGSKRRGHTGDRPEMLSFLEMSLTFWKKFRGVDKYV